MRPTISPEGTTGANKFADKDSRSEPGAVPVPGVERKRLGAGSQCGVGAHRAGQSKSDKVRGREPPRAFEDGLARAASPPSAPWPRRPCSSCAARLRGSARGWSVSSASRAASAAAPVSNHGISWLSGLPVAASSSSPLSAMLVTPRAQICPLSAASTATSRSASQTSPHTWFGSKDADPSVARRRGIGRDSDRDAPAVERKNAGLRVGAADIQACHKLAHQPWGVLLQRSLLLDRLTECAFHRGLRLVQHLLRASGRRARPVPSAASAAPPSSGIAT